LSEIRFVPSAGTVAKSLQDRGTDHEMLGLFDRQDARGQVCGYAQPCVECPSHDR
jgi:hypothetical protein